LIHSNWDGIKQRETKDKRNVGWWIRKSINYGLGSVTWRRSYRKLRYLACRSTSWRKQWRKSRWRRKEKIKWGLIYGVRQIKEIKKEETIRRWYENKQEYEIKQQWQNNSIFKEKEKAWEWRMTNGRFSVYYLSKELELVYIND